MALLVGGVRHTAELLSLSEAVHDHGGGVAGPTFDGDRVELTAGRSDTTLDLRRPDSVAVEGRLGERLWLVPRGSGSIPLLEEVGVRTAVVGRDPDQVRVASDLVNALGAALTTCTHGALQAGTAAGVDSVRLLAALSSGSGDSGPVRRAAADRLAAADRCGGTPELKGTLLWELAGEQVDGSPGTDDDHPAAAVPPGEDGARVRVGFVGLGAMGSVLAEQLLGAGVRLAVFDIDPERAHGPAFARARVASRIECLSDCEVILTCLPTSGEVSTAVDAITRAVDAPRTFVDLTTGDPEVTRAIAARHQGAGHVFVDASISGGILGARSGRMALFVGGDGAAVARVRAILSILSPSRLQHLGPLGSGQVAKLLNNYLAGMGRYLMAEAVALALRAGLDAAEFVAACEGSWAHSHHSAVTFPECVLSNRSSQRFRLALMLKDVRLAAAMAERAGAPLPGAGSAIAAYERASTELGPHAEVNNIVTWVLDQAKVPVIWLTEGNPAGASRGL